MKEVTYEDWQKNPTSRMMWVWSNDETFKEKRKVVFILRGNHINKVITIDDDEYEYETYGHCAEIEKQRRMTNKELSRWLREKPMREYKYQTSDYVYGEKNYRETVQDEEVTDNILIREDNSEWREPLVDYDKR